MTVDTGSISDGFHTFDELYVHRTALFAAICRLRQDLSWRSMQHHPDDLPMYDGFFIAGMSLPIGDRLQQVSYHCLNDTWPLFEGVPELLCAPRWDGHTPADTVERLNAWQRLNP